MAADKQLAHQLIDRLDDGQLGAVVHLLEILIHDENSEEGEDALTAEDRRAVAVSRAYFLQGGEGLSFEQAAAECGFTPDQLRETTSGNS